MGSLVESLTRPGDRVDTGEDGTNIPIIEGGERFSGVKRNITFSFGGGN